jgi:hypothetical protein
MTRSELLTWLKAARETAPGVKISPPPPLQGRWQVGVRPSGLTQGFLIRRAAQEPAAIEYRKGAAPAVLKGAKKLKATPFTTRLAAGLPAVFADFHALHPVSHLVSEWEGGKALESWSLRLRTGVPWPLFLRCDLAQPYAGSATELAYLMRDRRVVELSLSPQGMVAWNE